MSIPAIGVRTGLARLGVNPDGTMQVRLEQLPPMPDELKDAVAAEGGGQLPEELK